MPDLFETPSSGEVRLSAELIRVHKMPRRQWSDEEAAELAREMTDALRTPYGSMELRPLQAVALCEIGMYGGLFAPLRCGAGKCVTGDTEIFDAGFGRRRRASDEGIFTVVAKNDQGRLELASAVAQPSGKKLCVRVLLKDGSEIEVSKDHPIYTARGWIAAIDLRADDHVATCRRIPAPRQFTQARDEEVILAAYLLADGSVSHGATQFTNASIDILTEFYETVEALADASKNLGKGWKHAGVTTVKQPSQAYELNVAGLSWFRRKWGINGRSKEKRVPAEFWGLPDTQVALFLNRFWACDGWIGKTGPGIVLASEKLIDDLRFMLLRLGVHARKSFKPSRLGEKIFNAWRLTIPAHSAETFFETVGEVLSKEHQCKEFLAHHRSLRRNTNVDVVPLSRLAVPRICDELGYQGVGGDWRTRKGRPRSAVARFFTGSNDFISRSKFASFCEHVGYAGKFAWLATSDLCWERVESVEPTGLKKVYDLSVPGFGNFVGNNFVLHNTLISLLAPVVAFAERPLLLVPAKLVDKTERDRRALAEHWRLPSFLRIMTYEWLGRVQAADALEAFLPDMIIPDEFHKLANLRAAVTRRVRRHMNEHPEVKFVPMSGTMTKRSGHDYAHGARWALGPDRLFLPRRYDELELWCDALDERKGQVRRADPGALRILCDADEQELWRRDSRAAARSAFRRRMVDTPGVVASRETPIDATLTVSGVECAVSPAVDAAFERLRNDWELPDGRSVLPEGTQIKEGLGVYRHARELALGFFYFWDPEPPREWMDARSRWHKFVRQVLKNSRTLDSPHQVALAHPSAPELLEWRAIKPSFKPRTVAAWIDDSVLEFCARWSEKNRGIIWTEHVEFGERLERDYGLTYYGEEGRSAAGEFIDDHPPGEPLVASINSNDEGRNLQAWSAALVTSAPANGKKWEQVLSRLHRDGQEADEVSFDVLVTCAEHAGAFWQAVSDCRYVEQAFGSPQKLLVAGINVLDAGELAQRQGARWRKG